MPNKMIYLKLEQTGLGVNTYLRARSSSSLDSGYYVFFRISKAHSCVEKLMYLCPYDGDRYFEFGIKGEDCNWTQKLIVK
jgi:hypothetical protein